jgi:hypothetical protein
MRTKTNFSNIIINGAILALIIMGDLGSSFAQKSVKAPLFDQNNILEQMIMGISTESMPRPFYYNNVILMEEKYNTFSVSSNINEDNTLEKPAIKISRLNNDDLGEYLLWASGLRRPFSFNYEAQPQNNSGENYQSVEDFLISAAHLQELISVDMAKNETNSEINTESYLEQFLIKAAGFNEQVANDDDFKSENNSESDLEQFLIMAAHLHDEIVIEK